MYGTQSTRRIVVGGHTIRRYETYDRFQKFVRSWKDGIIQHAGVIGRPGTGKSHEYESILRGTPHNLFRGRSSPLAMYEDVRKQPDSHIVFDDIGALLVDRSSVDFMKQVADSKASRTISWRTNALPEGERTFTCTSPVLVVLNQVPDNADVHAVLDRLDVIEFCPTKTEIIARMRSFAKSQKDVDILADAAVMPSLRTLKHFENWKKSQLNEIQELYDECGVSDSVQLIADIMSNHRKRDWIKEYEKATGKTYEAAKRDWGRKRGIAKQLLDARANP